MNLIDLDELKKYPIRKDHYDKEHGDVHYVFGVEDVLEYAEYLPVVDAIPVEWIENYICDLNTGKQTHHFDADEYISNSDEVYYLRYLLKKWKQEKQNGTD